MVPVVTPIGVNDAGRAYSINSDVLAGFIAKEMQQEVAEEDVNQVLRTYVLSKIRTIQTRRMDEIFYDFAMHQLQKNYPIALPEDFLKQQLLSNPDITPTILEKEFPIFLRQIKTNILEKALVKKGNLKLNIEDIEAVFKIRLRERLEPSLLQQIESLLDEIAAKQVEELLKSQKEEDKKQIAELQEEAMQRKLIDLLKATAQITEKELPQEQIIEKLADLRKAD